MNKYRVKYDGEVFTPSVTVNKMLNKPEIKNELSNLRSTFLETSAGIGAFTCAILNIKCKVALRKSLKFKRRCDQTLHFNRYILIALSSIYGIEIINENVDMLHNNMMHVFKRNYHRGIRHLHGTINKNVLLCAKLIIKINLVQGDSLKGINKDHQQLIFSEWKPVSKFKIKRIEFNYYNMIHLNNQLNLFNKNSSHIKSYPSVDITKIYKQNNDNKLSL